MSLNVSLMKGFVRYYNTLSKVGYVDRSSINSLIISNWVNKVLDGEYDMVVTDEQYKLLSNLYLCVAGNCLVPYQQYCGKVVVNKYVPGRNLRITEISENRFLEDNTVRTV